MYICVKPDELQCTLMNSVDQKKGMKLVKYTSSQDDSNSEQEDDESRRNQEGDNRGDQSEGASRARANSRNPPVDREQSHS